MTTPLKIAVDARPLAFPFNGIGRYTQSLLSEFAAADTAHSLCLYSDRPIDIPFELPRHWRLRHGGTSRRALSTPFAQLWFPWWAYRDSADVFWSPRHHLPLMMPKRTKTVVTIHDLVWKRFPETMSRGGQTVEALLMPASIRKADRVIAVSHFTKQEIGAFYPQALEKTVVIHEASSLKPSGPSITPPHLPRPYFLTVGSSEPRKNLARLLNAYAAYRKASPSPLDLVLVGSYSWGSDDLDNLIRREQMNEAIHQIKSVDDATLASLYAHAHALIMPSLYEGFGLPLVEALSFGIPSITSATTATAEICGSAGLLIDPQDSHAITQALLTMTHDHALHARLTQQAKQQSRAFNWKQAAAETLEVFESAAASSNAARQTKP